MSVGDCTKTRSYMSSTDHLRSRSSVDGGGVNALPMDSICSRETFASRRSVRVFCGDRSYRWMTQSKTKMSLIMANCVEEESEERNVRAAPDRRQRGK